MSDVAVPSETLNLKRTPLHPLHAELGARFGAFAGWELPMYYSSILQEHQAVRQAVGLFDVSHLGHLEVSGEGAGANLQLLVTQDLEFLQPGKALYNLMLNSRGWILDDMIIYRLEPNRFRPVVNAANGDKILAWLRSRAHGARVEDLREKVGTLALQGPRAGELLAAVSSLTFERLPRYGVMSAAALDRPVWVTRTGYTGEDGCEFFVPVEDLPQVFRGLLEAGKPFGLQPIGLGARDTLRLEAGLPLGGSDLDERTTPLEAGLEWTIAWKKGPFVGRESLERQRREGVSRRLAGFELLEPGVPRPGCPIFRQEQVIGKVTSGTLLAAPAPGVRGRGIGLGYVPPAAAKPGTEIFIEIHRRRVPARICQLPFYRRVK